MIEFFETYSFNDIVLFAILAFLAIKEFIGWTDWGKEKWNERIAAALHSKEDKKELESLKKKVDAQDNALIQIGEKLDDIQSELKSQHEVDVEQLRYSIISLCEEAINLKSGDFPENKMNTLRGLYSKYDGVFHQNGYVHDAYADVCRIYNFNGKRKENHI